MNGLRAPAQFSSALNIAVTAVAAETAIPNTSNGERARFILLITGATAADDIRFLPIQSGETPATVNMVKINLNVQLVVNVHGFTHLRHVSVNPDDLCVVPLENIR
jgi:hypothetical protein